MGVKSNVEKNQYNKHYFSVNVLPKQMAEQLFFFSGLIPEKLGVTKRKSIKLSTMLRRLKPHSAGLHRKENTKTTHGHPFIHTLQTHTHTHRH